MKILHYINRLLNISIFIYCVLLVAANTVRAHSVTSDTSSGTAGRQITFTSTFTFDSQMGTAIAYINYGDGTGEQILDTNLVKPNLTFYSTTYTSTHTYLKKGTYTVSVRTVFTGGAATVVGPNPATKSQRISSGINISRIRLYFDNNRPDTAIKRNQKAPGLYAKIDYSGSGNFKGYWEIDGVKRAPVFKNFAKGPSVTLQYPSVPPLPTHRFGTHRVRFVVTSPAMNINFPYGIYFVTSDEAPPEPLVIKLIEPSEGETFAYEPVTFKWQPLEKSVIYLLNVFSKEKEERVFSAYTRQGSYELQPSTLKLYMAPGEEYLWNVVGFDDENEITGESVPSSFKFNQDDSLQQP